MGEDDPLFLDCLRVMTPHLGWMAGVLHCSLWLLVKRITLFFDSAFDTVEDFRLSRAATALRDSLKGLCKEDWRGLVHVTTSPTPRAGRVRPDILRNGLGPVGCHEIPQDIWNSTVPDDFYGDGLRDFNVESGWTDDRGNCRPATPAWVSGEVEELVSVLKRDWLLYDLQGSPTPTCWPFVIPESSEKVSLILSCVKQNGMDGCRPPRFSLKSWEQLSTILSTFSPGVPLYSTHIDLKTAFWSFLLPESAHTMFRLRSAPNGKVVGIGRLPFGWKYSPYICQHTLARVVGEVLPDDILPVHYLDDFLLVHPNKRYLKVQTGGVVDHLVRNGFIVSPKSVMEAAIRLVFLGKQLDLVVRKVWSHPVAHLQLFMAWIRLAVWRSQRRLMQSFLGYLKWHVRPRGTACPFAAGAYC